MSENLKLVRHHKNYSIYRENGKWMFFYSNSIIESIHCVLGDLDRKTYRFSPSKITVKYKTGETYTWETTHIDGYNLGQFGIAISNDGNMVFAQTWECGMFCLDAKTGNRIWRTKSKRGITSIFVGDNTITAQLHDYAMQLIDIKTGEVIKEKRPSTAWGFTTLDNRYILCHVTARKWEIIEAETMETKETFTHKEFMEGHTDFGIKHVELCEGGRLHISIFKNVWDNSVKPPKMLPNIELDLFLCSKVYGEKETQDKN